MKNIGNSTILLLVILAVALACKTTDKIESQFAGCITPNGKKIGIGIKNEAYVIDTKDGKILETLEVERKQGAVVCSPKNELFAVYSDEVKNVETGETFPRRIAGSTIIGLNLKNNLVGYEGGKIKNGNGKPLKIIVEKPNDQTDDLKLFELALDKLDAVKRNERSFLTIPVKLLDNNTLLVFAGGKARTIPADEYADFDPDIWGFYTVKLENGEIERTKIIDKALKPVGLFRSPITDATLNGKIIALTSVNNKGKIVLVFDNETGEEIFRQSFDERIESGRNSFELKEISSIALSKDGSKLAVAAVWADSSGKSYQKQIVIDVFDLQEKSKIGRNIFDKDINSIINFDNDELIINFDNSSVAKINAMDGKEIWKTDLAKR